MSAAAAAAAWIGLLALLAAAASRRRASRRGRLEVLERTVLGPKCSLAVARAGRRCWLLGVSAAGRVDRIAELDCEEWLSTESQQPERLAASGGDRRSAGAFRLFDLWKRSGAAGRRR